MSKSNWNKMANWYDSMVGSQGHKYHQQYAIPTVMKLLKLKPNDKVLDVGCGQGALAPYVKQANGKYCGIDVSKNLIAAAIKRHKKDGMFVVASATKLLEVKELHELEFEHAVFMLSIQDMDPLDKIINQVAKKLSSGGSIVIFMLHPAFRIPRQSGWGEDKQRKLWFRRVDRYMSANTIPLNTNIRDHGKKITSYFYHRPLQTYFTELKKNGFAVVDLVELAEKKKGYDEFPMFLGLKAIKN
jgi:ubiquinone/menaquinone biosynthesis C-methylase UbiE